MLKSPYLLVVILDLFGQSNVNVKHKVFFSDLKFSTPTVTSCHWLSLLDSLALKKNDPA